MANTYLGEGRLDTEKNDCTVISFSYACGISYQNAHMICKAHGRKDKHGFHINRVFRVDPCVNKKVKRRFIGNKYEIKYFPRPHMTLKSLLKFRPTGIFICTVGHHSFCIKDGVVYNQHNENQLIKYYFEVKNVQSG